MSSCFDTSVPQAPKNFIIKTRSRSSLTIAWEPIQAPHGKIIAYEVQYWRTGNTDANHKLFNKSTVNENSIVLTDLPMNIEFIIKVSTELCHDIHVIASLIFSKGPLMSTFSP